MAINYDSPKIRGRGDDDDCRDDYCDDYYVDCGDVMAALGVVEVEGKQEPQELQECNNIRTGAFQLLYSED